MSDSESGKAKNELKGQTSSPSAQTPLARLTGGDSGEIRVIERVVRETETSVPSMMLTRTNYMEWSLFMQVKLQASGLWGAVKDGTGDEREDRRALSVILTGVPPEMMRVLAAKDTAKVAWETIKTLRMGSERVREAKAQVRRREFGCNFSSR